MFHVKHGYWYRVRRARGGILAGRWVVSRVVASAPSPAGPRLGAPFELTVVSFERQADALTLATMLADRAILVADVRTMPVPAILERIAAHRARPDPWR